MNVLLIGARASGKSTIGRALAALIRFRFVDLDSRVLVKLGVSTVSEAWTTHGEAGWRGAEAQVLAEILAADRQVIALGGGTPMIPNARQMIEIERSAGRARVVYLRCDAKTLLGRLSKEPGDRPRLLDGTLADEVGTILAERGPTYLRLADLEVDTAASSVQDTAARIASWMQNSSGG